MPEPIIPKNPMGMDNIKEKKQLTAVMLPMLIQAMPKYFNCCCIFLCKSTIFYTIVFCFKTGLHFLVKPISGV